MLEVTEQRPMNNEYANSWISKLSPMNLKVIGLAKYLMEKDYQNLCCLYVFN